MILSYYVQVRYVYICEFKGKFIQNQALAHGSIISINLYLQAGLGCAYIDWENMEIGTDDYIEEFYDEGREDELLDPNHFQGLFLLMGCLVSTGLGKSS